MIDPLTKDSVGKPYRYENKYFIYSYLSTDCVILTNTNTLCWMKHDWLPNLTRENN